MLFTLTFLPIEHRLSIGQSPLTFCGEHAGLDPVVRRGRERLHEARLMPPDAVVRHGCDTSIRMKAGIEMDVDLETVEELRHGVWEIIDRNVTHVDNLIEPPSQPDLALFEANEG